MLFEKQIEAMYRKNLYVRQDNAGEIFYFAPEDFPGLQAREYDFKSDAGHDLRGYFYFYGDPIPGRLVVFDHGMGNGHRAYMREIEQLCQGGFLVYSYDHTGCMRSGGQHCNGFATSLRDLDACITALEAEPALRDRTISVMGHSWGGFSTMNIAALHPKITHVVSMSGFASVEKIVGQNFSGLLKPYQKLIMDLERRSNPKYVDFDAAQSLENCDAKVLLIYADDDKIVHKNVHYDYLSSRLSGKKNVRFLVVTGKNHNPSYTTDAVKYKDDFFATYQKRLKKLTDSPSRKAFMDRYDWRRMTQQDAQVWGAVIAHLKDE